MAAAAAAAAATKAKVKEAQEKKSTNKAAMLFVGGAVILAGAVGYAKWAEVNPSPNRAKLAEKKANAAAASSATAKDAAAKEAKAAAQAHEESQARRAEQLIAEKEAKAAAKKAQDDLTAEQEAADKKAKEEEDAAAALEAKKRELKEKKEAAAKLKQPFAGAASDDDEEAKKKKQAAAEEQKKKEAAAAAAAEAAKKKAEDASIEPLINALKKVATINLDQIEIETDVSRRPYFAGHHVFAKTDINADDTVLSMPGSLQFSVRSVDRQLQNGLAVLVHHSATIPSIKDHLANSPYYNITTLLPKLHDTDALFNLNTDGEDDSVDETASQPSSALDGDIHLLTLSLILEKRKEKRSIWHPWIDSLPPIHHLAVNHGMFVSDEEFTTCLPNRGQKIVNSMRTEMLWIRNATGEMCRAQIPMLEPKLEAFREQQKKQEAGQKIDKFIKFSELERAAIMARFLTCDVKQAEFDWAYSIISARAHLLGNVRTIFPLVDVLPYTVGATIKPGKIQATDDGKIVSVDFVAARKIEADEPLSFRTSIREPLEAVLAQGFFETDFFTETTVPLGLFYHQFADGPTHNPLNVIDGVLDCSSTLEARSVPESGAIPHEMILCAELVFLKNVTNTADDDVEGLGKLRSEHVAMYLMDKDQRAKAAADKKNVGGDNNAKIVEGITAHADIRSVPLHDGELISAQTRLTLRERAIEFINAAVDLTTRVFDTKKTCTEDARPLMGEIQAHNDYVVAILDKSKFILTGIKRDDTEVHQ